MIEKLKRHIHWEEGMNENMLSIYVEAAQKYVKTATGGQTEYLVLLVAAIMYDYRVSDWQMKEALDAITPFFVQEVFGDGTEEVPWATDEQS